MSDKDGAVIDRLFAALAAGDVAAAVDCYTPDGVLWHGFDGIAQDRDAIRANFEGLVVSVPERGVEDVRRQATATGFVQQHVFVARTAQGRRIAWPVCIVVQVRDGKIARLDEYIDRAGSFAVGEGAVKTPGH